MPTKRRELIDPQRAMETAPYGKMLPGSDTVYISVIDGAGNACSLINSVFANFGSGLVVPGTGIVMHNRAALFQLDPEHPNALAGRKRPPTCSIPSFRQWPTRDGELWLSYGVMGGFMQPQGHLQVISNMVDFGMDSQTALDALRFQVAGDELWLEGDVDNEVAAELHGRGHRGQRDARPATGRRRWNGRRPDNQPRPGLGRPQRRQRAPEGRRRGRLVSLPV